MKMTMRDLTGGVTRGVSLKLAVLSLCVASVIAGRDSDRMASRLHRQLAGVRRRLPQVDGEEQHNEQQQDKNEKDDLLNLDMPINGWRAFCEEQLPSLGEAARRAAADEKGAGDDEKTVADEVEVIKKLKDKRKIREAEGIAVPQATDENSTNVNVFATGDQIVTDEGTIKPVPPSKWDQQAPGHFGGFGLDGFLEDEQSFSKTQEEAAKRRETIAGIGGIIGGLAGMGVSGYYVYLGLDKYINSNNGQYPPSYLFILLGISCALFMFSASALCGQNKWVAAVSALAFGSVIGLGLFVAVPDVMCYMKPDVFKERCDPALWVVACAAGAVFMLALCSAEKCSHVNTNNGNAVVARTGVAVIAMLMGAVGVAGALLVNLPGAPYSTIVPEAAHVPAWVGFGMASAMLLGGLLYICCNMKKITKKQNKCFWL